MTLERNKLLASIESRLNDYPDVAERWRAGDPTVRAMMVSLAEMVVQLQRDNAVNSIEPFIKSKDRTIKADAVNKSILPAATPCQHLLTVENGADVTLTLSQGRLVEDGTGRQWRLLAAVTVAAGKRKKVLAEQSVIVRSELVMPINEPFYSVKLSTTDEAYFAAIAVTNTTVQEPYHYAPNFMNAAINAPAYTLQSDDLRDIEVIFGADGRAGKTVQAGESYEFAITQCYGVVETSSLGQAALASLATADESRLNLYFKAGDMQRAGANPLSVNQLRLLASFPSMYDHNAVFMGNFTFLIMQHFMQRFDYMAVWNETAHDKYYGASLEHINHLHLAVQAKNAAEQDTLVADIQRLVARADSLLDGRVIVHKVEERPYNITISGRLAAVHDMDSVRMQIKELLLASYGKGSLSAIHHNADGFNRQEIATKIRSSIAAFQDRISDFVVDGEIVVETPIQPHQWAYLAEDTIMINLTRTADSGNAVWTM